MAQVCERIYDEMRSDNIDSLIVDIWEKPWEKNGYPFDDWILDEWDCWANEDHNWNHTPSFEEFAGMIYELRDNLTQDDYEKALANTEAAENG